MRLSLLLLLLLLQPGQAIQLQRRRSAVQWLLGWRDEAVSSAAREQLGVHAGITHLRKLAGGALAHWRMLHLRSKIKNTWLEVRIAAAGAPLERMRGSNPICSFTRGSPHTFSHSCADATCVAAGSSQRPRAEAVALCRAPCCRHHCQGHRPGRTQR